MVAMERVRILTTPALFLEYESVLKRPEQRFASGMSVNKAAYPLKLPISLKAAAQRLAREDGVSLNWWITVALAEKVGAVETAAEFFKKRAGHARPVDLLPFLERAGNEPPPPSDKTNLAD